MKTTLIRKVQLREIGNIFSMTTDALHFSPLLSSIHFFFQATALLIENLDILIDKTARSDFQSDVLPMILSAFETNSPQLQVCCQASLFSFMSFDIL